MRADLSPGRAALRGFGWALNEVPRGSVSTQPLASEIMVGCEHQLWLCVRRQEYSIVFANSLPNTRFLSHHMLFCIRR
jgi:hypothetical protein